MTSAAPGPITFWFDFGSPYAWLASTQVAATARRCGRTVRWRAMLLGVIFGTTGASPLGVQPLRGDYARRDLGRVARRMGLPFATATPPSGTSLALARVFHAIALRDEALAARFAAEAFMATFAEGQALDGLAAAQCFAARLGPTAAAASADALAPAARLALRDATQEALAQGVFGAPFFVVDGEPFWGQDRLPMLEAWLREGPW
ncbi:2-hydroxychromene-2-carboxylate isomerase [Roseomonas sp. CECT 9278]|uniref:2-hydroxychromene-2-carboxylate isomerase n=1 Tax=Roseomonas sp. CECT 9278 TaxID=2845823 RepID=UPI001E4D6DB9|nr:DsbA family protein [Roseomonas sp. CECT 9278]CAH0131653.1 2-hydroxychromene-2-carboxylate isomerase [Roseomonas sp. CECT 9278]